jgi:hypothetical protein
MGIPTEWLQYKSGKGKYVSLRELTSRWSSTFSTHTSHEGISFLNPLERALSLRRWALSSGLVVVGQVPSRVIALFAVGRLARRFQEKGTVPGPKAGPVTKAGNRWVQRRCGRRAGSSATSGAHRGTTKRNTFVKRMKGCMIETHNKSDLVR